MRVCVDEDESATSLRFTYFTLTSRRIDRIVIIRESDQNESEPDKNDNLQ